jgi:hypothetical protein
VTLIGFGSGGHIGNDNVASFILLPKAVEALDIPVIAGGGICNGRGFLAALAMGGRDQGNRHRPAADHHQQSHSLHQEQAGG